MDKDLIKQLREQTAAPIMKIKEALAAAGNEAVKAIEWLKANWKPVDKETAFSKIFSYCHLGRIGVLVEVGCGTDFVANTKEFHDLCLELAYQVVAGLEGPLEEQVYVRDSSRFVKDLIGETSKKLGETIKVKRYLRWSV